MINFLTNKKFNKNEKKKSTIIHDNSISIRFTVWKSVSMELSNFVYFFNKYIHDTSSILIHSFV